jgi:hypothetical protein
VYTRELEQQLLRAAGTGRRADECEHNFVGIHRSSVGHIDCDVPYDGEQPLLLRYLRQRELRHDGVVETAVWEAISEGENRFSGVKFVRAARVCERRPHWPAEEDVIRLQQRQPPTVIIMMPPSSLWCHRHHYDATIIIMMPPSSLW